MARPERNLPIFVVLIFGAALATLVPSFYGAAVGDFESARVFFYSGLLFVIASALLWLAVAPSARSGSEQRYLLTLVLSYLWLPGLLSLPMMQLRADLALVDVYFDMVSALTTTGAVVFAPERLGETAHLWRATVGWFGGALIWLTALAVLAPLNLGGFEVTSEASPGQRGPAQRGQMGAVTASGRLYRHVVILVPVYLGLTILLAIALSLAGERPLHAVIHAMSTLSTSGISAVGGPRDGSAGRIGELLIVIFFVFALTRRSFSGGFDRRWPGVMAQDRELRLALLIVGVLSCVLFARHWVGAYLGGALGDVGLGASALWGTGFTVISFLTTTGFVSGDWAAAGGWSGVPMPGLVLVGLVLVGGGVATTAGGLKLLRVYALYKHGTREIDRLIHPSSVAGAGRLGRRIRQEGAYIAWIFFMLLLVTIGAILLALTATGLGFEAALIFAIAALSTTGPLADVAGQVPLSYGALGDPAKLVLVVAMIIGRLETLVFLAVFNPSFWRA
jgi:trk system potassium uptake protein TrkH